MADLITLSYAQTMIGPLSAPKAAALTQAIADASELIRKYCGRDFEVTTYTELYDGDGTNTLILNQFPAISVTSVTTGLPLAPVVLDTSVYGFKPKTGELRLIAAFQTNDWEAWSAQKAFPEGWQNVQVIYQAGYTSIPGPVMQAAAQTAKSLIDQAPNSNVVDNVRLADWGESKNVNHVDRGIPGSAQDLLAPYRDRRI